MDEIIKNGGRPVSNGMTLALAHALLAPEKRPLSSQPMTFWACGLGEEAGEVLGVIKKATHREIWADGSGALQDDYDARLLEEAGNVLFYLRQVLEIRGLTLEMAARRQIEILAGIHAGDA